LKELKSERKNHLRNGRKSDAKAISKLIFKLVNKKRSIEWREKLKNICANKQKHLSNWWKLTTRIMKPFDRESKLMLDMEGVKS
jgi:L-rhamnose mutarotase